MSPPVLLHATAWWLVGYIHHGPSSPACRLLLRAAPPPGRPSGRAQRVAHLRDPGLRVLPQPLGAGRHRPQVVPRREDHLPVDTAGAPAGRGGSKIFLGGPAGKQIPKQTER